MNTKNKSNFLEAKGFEIKHVISIVSPKKLLNLGIASMHIRNMIRKQSNYCRL